MPPVYGLYTACFPLIIYSLLGTSGQLSVGPVAVVSLLVGEGAASIVHPHLETGEPNPQFISTVIAVCLLVSHLLLWFI
jgi:SulP family sulfate permease